MKNRIESHWDGNVLKADSERRSKLSFKWNKNGIHAGKNLIKRVLFKTKNNCWHYVDFTVTYFRNENTPHIIANPLDA